MHWLIVVLVAALLFGGRGKISGLMGDFAKGIKAFKSGMKEEEPTAAADLHPQVTTSSGSTVPPGTAASAHAGTEVPPGGRA
jgi:sec-independent protein translocase protein TatA